MAFQNVYLQDDKLRLLWELSTSSKIDFADGINIKSTFPSYKSSKELIEKTNMTFLLDEWINERFLFHRIRYSSPMTNEDRETFSIDIENSMFDPDKVCSAWFEVSMTNGHYDLPFENSKTGTITFYGGLIKGTVLYSITKPINRSIQKKRTKKTVFVLLKLEFGK